MNLQIQMKMIPYVSVDNKNYNNVDKKSELSKKSSTENIISENNVSEDIISEDINTEYDTYENSINNEASASSYVEPKVTITNITEIRDNQLNVTMSSNVNGTIYYTRNGSMPDINSRVYVDGQVLTISVKTQINAIVVTASGITSNITHYQSEQIIHRLYL